MSDEKSNRKRKWWWCWKQCLINTSINHSKYRNGTFWLFSDKRWICEDSKPVQKQPREYIHHNLKELEEMKGGLYHRILEYPTKQSLYQRSTDEDHISNLRRKDHLQDVSKLKQRSKEESWQTDSREYPKGKGQRQYPKKHLQYRREQWTEPIESDDW